jgi:hypothetical protein
LNNGYGEPDLFYLFNTHFAYILTDAADNAVKTIKYISRVVDVAKVGIRE